MTNRRINITYNSHAVYNAGVCYRGKENRREKKRGERRGKKKKKGSVLSACGGVKRLDRR